MKNTIYVFISFVCLSVFASCSEKGDDSMTDNPMDPFAELNLPEEHFNYANIELPDHYTVNNFPPQAQFQHAVVDFDNTPADNPVTDAGATLGRVLFYDKKLSANGTIACALCHQQEFGFDDPRTQSEGFDGGLTRRHSMGLTNARFYYSGKFFWDERAASLEEQVLMPFQDPVEMGLSLESLEAIVSEQHYYPPLFENAFGDREITTDRISKALAQFIRSMVSTRSKYDKARSEVDNPMDNFPGFTELENMGKNLFYLPVTVGNGDRVSCAGCHVTEAFLGPLPPGPFGTTTSVTNGLDAISTDDQGIYETTGNPNDIGKFKSPSLRNIAVRNGYMHDGRFETLEEVIDFYSTGIQKHPNLTPPLLGSDGEPVKFNFSATEKEALIAFMHTLTDEEMLTDEKYSNPFK